MICAREKAPLMNNPGLSAPPEVGGLGPALCGLSSGGHERTRQAQCICCNYMTFFVCLVRAQKCASMSNQMNE